MTKKTLIIAACLLSIWEGLSQAGQKILSIQSLRIRPYEEVFRGFERAVGLPIYRLVTEEEKKNPEEIVWVVGPDLVFAIGLEGLEVAAKSASQMPVVYAMVLNPEPVVLERVKATGVRMMVAPEFQLRRIKEALAGVNRIGLLYDPFWVGDFVVQARREAQRLGFSLVEKEIRHPDGVPAALADLRGKIDAYWMLPVPSTTSPETVEALFLFSLNNRIPVVTFSDKYLEMGALMSIGFDAYDAGTQAGRIAQKILSGTPIEALSWEYARKGPVSINLRIAGKLGIPVDRKALPDARFVE